MRTAVRAEARRQLVQAANRWKVNSYRRRRWGFPPRLLSMRQVQLAVFICRQNDLVRPSVLHAAGFRLERDR